MRKQETILGAVVALYLLFVAIGIQIEGLLLWLAALLVMLPLTRILWGHRPQGGQEEQKEMQKDMELPR